MLSIQCAKKNRAANDQKHPQTTCKERDEKGDDSGDVRYQLYAIIVLGVSTSHVSPTAIAFSHLSRPHGKGFCHRLRKHRSPQIDGNINLGTDKINMIK